MRTRRQDDQARRGTTLASHSLAELPYAPPMLVLLEKLTLLHRGRMQTSRNPPIICERQTLHVLNMMLVPILVSRWDCTCRGVYSCGGEQIELCGSGARRFCGRDRTREGFVHFTGVLLQCSRMAHPVSVHSLNEIHHHHHFRFANQSCKLVERLGKSTSWRA